jgi:hypothetical protein
MGKIINKFKFLFKLLLFSYHCFRENLPIVITIIVSTKVLGHAAAAVQVQAAAVASGKRIKNNSSSTS